MTSVRQAILCIIILQLIYFSSRAIFNKSLLVVTTDHNQEVGYNPPSTEQRATPFSSVVPSHHNLADPPQEKGIVEAESLDEIKSHSKDQYVPTVVSHHKDEVQEQVTANHSDVIQNDQEMMNLTPDSIPLYERNYFELTGQSYFPRASELLLPLQVMHAYIEEHSEARLEQLWQDCGSKTPCEKLDSTKFIVGRYSCPLQAGNRLVKFMNGLIWAIVTDRVFLWDYFDRETCLEEQSSVAAGTCEGFLNTVEECENILQLASWVPSYDKWSKRLNLTKPQRAFAIGKLKKVKRDTHFLPMDKKTNPRALYVGPQRNLECGIQLASGDVSEVLTKLESIEAARKLFKEDIYFAYGMMFESLFTFDSSLFSGQALLQGANIDSYVLHSRHVLPDEKGTDIAEELTCLEKAIPAIKTRTNPCVVFIMTDRQAARDMLVTTLQTQFNCTTIISQNTTLGRSTFHTDHGDFAGRGYFQDLAVARHARSGFLSPGRKRPRVGIRTSSALPRSMIEFRGRLETLLPGTSSTATTFRECSG